MENFININAELSWHYIDKGEKDKPVIIFLHGFPDFHLMWNEQIKKFKDDFRCIAPDMTGYNLSSKPDNIEEYKVTSVVEHLKCFVDKLSLKKIVLVGHDWGGIVSWVFSSKYDYLLEKLVIINAPHPDIYQDLLRNYLDQQKLADYALFFRTKNAEKLISRRSYKAIHDMKNNLISLENRIQYHNAWSQDGAIASMLNYYCATQINIEEGVVEWEDFQLDDNLSSCRISDVNTLVIWGDKDTALNIKNIIKLESMNKPNISILRFEENSHWIVDENPDLINNSLYKFLMK